ncbi:MAG: SDR family oxidoreductase [Planctomycetota bacterium]
MQLRLGGQKVLVFGAGRGIGRAVAGAFADEGCHVIACDRDFPDASETESRVGDSISSRVIDVTDRELVQKMAAENSDVAHLIYAVGAGSGKAGFPFWNLDVDDWGRVMEVNLMGAVNVSHAFAPVMATNQQADAESPEGSSNVYRSILFFTSVAGQIGSPTDPPYSAAKAALINFMQVAARDLAGSGVRANALSPGMVKTTLNASVHRAVQENLPAAQRRSYEAWAGEKVKQIAPLGRWQTPAEYAAMATFLASHHAMNITGQTINVDGGQVMHA